MRLSSIIFVLLLIALFCGCSGRRARYAQAARITGGDPYAGQQKIRRYGCQSCHTIPGVYGADALVGPPLTHVSSRMVIAGQLPNTPSNLEFWIQHPHAVLPHTVMPEMGVTEQDSRDIAAYLTTLH